jgi:dipeptidyl aminopeptidase/acylaminoacyl peptidase
MNGRKKRCPLSMHFEERTAVTLKAEGKKIFGILHLPTDKQKCPAVLFCHGFGGNKSGRFRFFVLLSEALAKQGIASLRFDYRGSGDSEGEIIDMTPQKQIEDTCLAARLLFTHPQIDKTRFGILGRSFGGAIASKASVKIGTIKSIALIAPFFDAGTWLAEKERKTSDGIFSIEDNRVSFAGQPLAPECIHEITHLDVEHTIEELGTTPLLLVQGLKDTVLGLDHFEKYKQARPDAELLVLKETDHEFSEPNERALALEKIALWFTRTL